MTSTSKGNAWSRLRRLAVMGFVLVYLATGLFFFHGHLLGDSRGGAWAYFWTWDMFPNYPSFSARRIALGQTRDGRFVRVFPNAMVRYRRGGQRDLTRFDLPRNDHALRQAAQETLRSRSPRTREDSITYVFLVEHYWPVRFNLPDPLYREAFGEENPHRSAYRILDEGPVGETGEIRWTSTQ